MKANFGYADSFHPVHTARNALQSNVDVVSVKPYSDHTIARFCQSVISDGFDDAAQNEAIYDDVVSGFDSLKKLLLDIGSSPQTILNVGAGSTVLDLRVDKVYSLEPNPTREDKLTNDNRIEGWCENIKSDIEFDVIVCWGTMCFVRSVPESLIQFNDRLKIGGALVLDVVKSTNFALAQTTDPSSFVRYAGLFGFELHHRIAFGHLDHQREGFRFVKVREFDPRYLMMPQAKNGVRNFLFERDWSLA